MRKMNSAKSMRGLSVSGWIVFIVVLTVGATVSQGLLKQALIRKSIGQRLT